MSEFWGYFVIVFMALITVVFMALFSQKNYGNGYAKGFQDGEERKYYEVFNVRLLRQAKRASREEKKNEPSGTEGSDAGVEGSTEPSDSEPGSGESGLFEHDADAGAGGTEPVQQ